MQLTVAHQLYPNCKAPLSDLKMKNKENWRAFSFKRHTDSYKTVESITQNLIEGHISAKEELGLTITRDQDLFEINA